MGEQANADRMIVVERLNAGATLDEATAEFCSDAYFQEWYARAKAALESIGVQLADHIIVADGDFVSMADSGYQ